MTADMIVLSIIMGFVGLLLLLFGYLIRVQSMATLIAGYDPKQVKDQKGLTNFVGGHVMLMGAVFCAYALAVLFMGRSLGWPIHAGAGLYLFVHSFWIMFKARRY
jgi:hypothetical protein